jgi:hypothetical protein
MMLRRASASDGPAMPAGADQVSFYDNQVPAFVEPALEQLYECLMSTVARFTIYDAAPNASTYVVRRDGQIRTLFLFRRERTHVQVYNEQMTLAADEITRFARQVFARYPGVGRISFYAIDTDAAAIPYPLVKRECLEDIVLALPATEQAYLSRLGKNTRASIKNRYNKLLRNFPTFRFDLLGKDEVTDSQIREIIGFNQARMAVKNQRCYHTEESTEQLIRLVRRYGMVGVASIDGRLCAGMISSRTGGHCMLQVATHDPRFDDHGLGQVCNYLNIVAAIAAGVRIYHFGWGRFEYKYRLLGEHKDLYRVELFRSRLSMFVHLRHVLAAMRVAQVRRLKRWLARVEQAGDGSGRGLAAAIGVLRSLKRALRPRQ